MKNEKYKVTHKIKYKIQRIRSAIHKNNILQNVYTNLHYKLTVKLSVSILQMYVLNEDKIYILIEGGEEGWTLGVPKI